MFYVGSRLRIESNIAFFTFLILTSVKGKYLQVLTRTDTEDQKINPTERMYRQTVVPKGMCFQCQIVMTLCTKLRIMVTVRMMTMMLIVS